MSIAPPVALGRPQLLDINGQQVDYISSGQQGVIRIIATNNQVINQPVVIIVEVRDAIGVTEYISWQKGTLTAGDRHYFEAAWMPNKGCSEASGGCYPDHEIRAFVLSDFEKPQVLTWVEILQGITVRAADYEGEQYKLHRVVVDDVEYHVEYVMDGGNVEQITADYDYRVVSSKKEGVT